jgi:hypothetical protein
MSKPLRAPIGKIPPWPESEKAVYFYLRAKPCDPCDLKNDDKFIHDPVYVNKTQRGCRERVKFRFGFRRCGGKDLEPMPRGSTAPDFYNRATKVAVEVKNVRDHYNLVRAILGERYPFPEDGLYHYFKPKLTGLEGQQGARYIGMPDGFKQLLFVEARGRVLNLPVLAAFLRDKLGGYTVFESIYFIVNRNTFPYFHMVQY